MAADLPGDQPVPLGDLEIAERIAKAARGGRPVDRAPTFGQLMAAFAEPEPTDAARRRIRAALQMAEVSTQPDIMDAAPDARVLLRAAGAGPSTKRIAIGAAALVAVVGGAALAATLGGGSSNDNVASQLPLETTTTQATATATAPGATTTTTTPAQTTPVATATSPAATATTTVGTTTAPSTTTATTLRTTTTPAPRPKPKPRPRPVSRQVSVRLFPTQPTFLCAKDGFGHVLFSGTLSSPRRFLARRVRLNVGLGPSTRVFVNGKPLALTSSPAGYDISRQRRFPLGNGARPTC